MAKLHRMGPDEVAELLRTGHRYIDVRTPEEFGEGHVPNAYNVPVFLEVGGIRTVNDEFVGLVKELFAPDEKLVIGCRSGVRSLHAAKLLQDAGVEELWELRPGWDGSRDAFGRHEPGWSRHGLPVESGQPAGFCYADLRQRLGRA